jgi:hypothetical protein
LDLNRCTADRRCTRRSSSISRLALSFPSQHQHDHALQRRHIRLRTARLASSHGCLRRGPVPGQPRVFARHQDPVRAQTAPTARRPGPARGLPRSRESSRPDALRASRPRPGAAACPSESASRSPTACHLGPAAPAVKAVRLSRSSFWCAISANATKAHLTQPSGLIVERLHLPVLAEARNGTCAARGSETRRFLIHYTTRDATCTFSAVGLHYG